MPADSSRPRQIAGIIYLGHGHFVRQFARTFAFQPDLNGRKSIMHARTLFYIVAFTLLIVGCNRLRDMGSRDVAHELVGKASPLFTAPLLDGGELRLEDELGKNVI